MKKIICVVGIMILFWGCTKTKEKKVPVNAWCEGFLNSWGWQQAFLISDPVEDLNKCNASLKWDGNQQIFKRKERHPDGVYFTDTTIICTLATQYTLEISSQTFGKSSGSVFIPESTLITEPDWGDTLPIGNVQVTWTPSSNTDFYSLSIYIDAYDSFGLWISSQEIDTFLTTTSFTISSSHFQVPDAEYYYVDMNVFPYSGDLYSANMSGDFKGFLFGEGQGDWTSFYVGTPVVLKFSSSSKIPSFRERIEKIRKTIKRVIEE